MAKTLDEMKKDLCEAFNANIYFVRKYSQKFENCEYVASSTTAAARAAQAILDIEHEIDQQAKLEASRRGPYLRSL